MSVHVEIQVGNALSAGARRHLEISRITNNEPGVRGPEGLDLVSTYEAILTGGGRLHRVEIEHRFGDDVFILIQKASEALREVVPIL